MKSEIKTKDAKKGGYLVGKPHSEGGIKGINVDTGEPIEVEGGEVVITKPAVQSKEVYMFEGKEMTPKEILSKLNSDHGGVAFEKGGEVGEELYARGGGTRTRRTAAPSFEAEIEAVKKEDKSEKLKYQTLEEIIEQDITKWSILQGLVNKENTLRKNDINRKLAALREERDLYALKQQTSSELLQSLAKVFVKEKITQGTINPELLAPNGQPTMLTEDQYYKVRSQEFVDWYGDWLMAYDLDNYGGVSKTINDATKEPLVLYHGSQHDFARWRFEKFPAAYFADNMSYAQWFANYAGNGLLYQVFVDMKNPIDMRSFGVDAYPIRNYLQFIEENYLITPEQADARVAQFAKTDPANTEQYLDHPCRFWEYIRHINTDLLTYLRDNTFIDGIMMFENNPSDIVDGKENVTGSYVVFRTEQIKWASANHFNLLVKDARFEKGGKIDQSRKDEDILNSIDFGF